MKRSIGGLSDVIALGRRLGANRFMLSNLLPYSPQMCDEILYERTLNDIAYLPSPWLRKMQLDGVTGEPFLRVLKSHLNVTVAGNTLGKRERRVHVHRERLARDRVGRQH